MFVDIANVITAVATAATALYAMLQFHILKGQNDPHLMGELSPYGDKPGVYILRMRIHPATRPMRFVKVRADNAKIAEALLGVDRDGMAYFDPTAIPSAQSALPLELALAPDRISSEPEMLYLFVLPRNSSKAVIIALETRIMYLPVRYKLVLSAISAKA
ncbi:hypothetical protein [Achromobacter sp. 413638]|uniref:hypothetical protein n=1 Tax=Achromobacter sp. 413638 TaxID=3342385 RepID=UPI00370B0697